MFIDTRCWGCFGGVLAFGGSVNKRIKGAVGGLCKERKDDGESAFVNKEVASLPLQAHVPEGHVAAAGGSLHPASVPQFGTPGHCGSAARTRHTKAATTTAQGLRRTAEEREIKGENDNILTTIHKEQSSTDAPLTGAASHSDWPSCNCVRANTPTRTGTVWRVSDAGCW